MLLIYTAIKVCKSQEAGITSSVKLGVIKMKEKSPLQNFKNKKQEKWIFMRREGRKGWLHHWDPRGSVTCTRLQTYSLALARVVTVMPGLFCVVPQ